MVFFVTYQLIFRPVSENNNEGEKPSNVSYE